MKKKNKDKIYQNVQWHSIKVRPGNPEEHFLTYSSEIEGIKYRIISPSVTNNRFPSSVELWMELPEIDINRIKD